MNRRKVKPGNSSIAVAYMRVSKDEQQLGPMAQRQAIESWASREGVQIKSWHTDQGESGGAPLNRRPQLLLALESARVHGAGIVVIAKRDRIARGVKVELEIDEAIQAAGAQLLSADGVGNGVQPHDYFMKHVINGAAEYERKLIQARTKAALAVKQQRGQRMGNCSYGYREGANKVLIPDDHEQRIMALVIQLRDIDGMTERAIVAELARRKIHSRKGHQFSQTQVHRILERRQDETPWDQPVRYLRRNVQPFEDFEVDVNLYPIIEPFRKNMISSAMMPHIVEPIIDWIEQGFVRLDVMVLTKMIPEEFQPLIEKTIQYCSGQDDHKKLCALAAVYLESLGKEINVSGNSSCSYAGGWADVATKDNIFVECGTLNPDKLPAGLVTNCTMMLVPYMRGFAWSTKASEFLAKHDDIAYLFTPIDMKKVQEARRANDFKNAVDMGPVKVADFLLKGKPADAWVKRQIVQLRKAGVADDRILGALRNAGVVGDLEKVLTR